MKFTVTPELSKLLRMLRMQNNVSAKILAEHLGKSPSYISKLESGDMKTIRQEDLTDILSYIVSGEDFYEEILPGAVRVLYSFMEHGRLLDQIWLLQYDVIDRTVMVPEGMADDILAHLDKNGIRTADLVEIMNANIDSELSSAFLPNEMVSISYEGHSRLLIHVGFERAEIERVLYKKDLTASYFCIYSMVHSMFRMLNFPGEKKKLPPDSAVIILRLAGTYMEQWGIRSLTDFGQVLSSEEFISHQKPLASAGITVIDHIAEMFRELAGHEMLLTAKQLNTFYDTLNWDAAFAMKILGLPFADLGTMSFQNKKKLLEEISQLMEKYDQMPDFEKKLENY